MNSGYELAKSGQSTIFRAFSDGKIETSSTGLFEIHCDFDVSLFPFDQQLCILRFESIGYVVEMQSLHVNEFAFGDFWTNEQWDFKLGSWREINFTLPDGRTFSTIELDIHMKRKVLLNFIMTYFFLLTRAIFLLPGRLLRSCTNVTPGRKFPN